MGSWRDIKQFLGNYNLSDAETEKLLISVLKWIDLSRTNPKKFAEVYKGNEFDNEYGLSATMQAEGYLSAHFLISKPHGHIPVITEAGQRVIERGWVVHEQTKDSTSILESLAKLTSFFT
jgi:hypothetical protein